MKTIKLTQGKFTLVDNQDYDFLMQWRWYAHKGSNGFYAIRREFYKLNKKRPTVLMHRIIAERMGLKDTIDHINRNGLDNRRSNLRMATASQNGINTSKSKNNKSGFKGVYWNNHAKKWRADICFNRRHILLGYFDNKLDAAKAYNKAALKYFGEFACLNLI